MEYQASMKNPYDWINPIRDRDLFAGRKEELSRIIDEVIRVKEKAGITPIIAVTGERRVGKTSLLLRIDEICHEQHIKSIIIPVEVGKSRNSWELWNEIFSGLVLSAKKEGIDISGKVETPMGFTAEKDDPDAQRSGVLSGLLFPTAYSYYLSGSTTELSTFYIRSDLEKFVKAFEELGYDGLILIFDEAHLLLHSEDIRQQIRNTIQNVDDCGVVFAGETTLALMFTDPSEPFFGQATVVPLGNFMVLDDVVECCLQPLKTDEVKLISPMAVQYIRRLSRGKPNQIRLICSSIYKRYAKGQQSDLNMSIDVLDDVLESISQSHEDPDLKVRIASIKRLSSVNLELLYNMTRYPNWRIQDIIDLDESFRGDLKSSNAISRRKRCLQEKHKLFVELGLMTDTEDQYQLVGGEFVSLYLRFFYETQKYGKLSKGLILGKGPPTPFGEITEKLVRSLAFHFKQAPELQSLIFHHYYRDFGNIIEKVKRRFLVLDGLKRGQKLSKNDINDILPECVAICELIGKEGNYYLLCLSVRNRDNPRQIIQVELYFDLDQQYQFDLSSLFNLLNQQAEDARVLIEGYTGFWVQLPDFPGLLKSMGVAFEDILGELPIIHKWQLLSLQHLVDDRGKPQDITTDDDRDEETEKSKWISLYAKGEEEESEKVLIEKLAQTEERSERARLFNDLGYIRCGRKLAKIDIGRKDLETAIDLHYKGLQLTLLNLAYLDLQVKEYEKAIEKIEEALLLTLSPIQSNVAYLRMRLPENHLGFVLKCEQHPANIIEAAYINLAYSTLQSQGYEKGFKVLEEGVELFPKSIRIKHAMARFLVHKRRVDLSIPIYTEINELPSLDKYMQFEARYFQRHIKKKKKGKRR